MKAINQTLFLIKEENLLETVILLGVLAFASLVITILVAPDPKRWDFLTFAWAMVTIGFVFFLTNSAVNVFGYGHVPKEAEPLAKRLSAGVAYEVLGFIGDGSDKVIFVKPRTEVATPELYALRVKENEVPPKHFAMVAGKPVAIAITAVADKVAK